MARPAVLIGADMLFEALRQHWNTGNGLDTVRQMLGTQGPLLKGEGCMMKILVIGADPQTFETVGANLTERWPEAKTTQRANLADSLELLDGASSDAVLLYANFPDIETSVEAIRQIRSISNIPLMVLSPQMGEMEVVTALHFGADDYVRLPCGTPELMVRVSGLLRRAGSVIRHDAEKPIFKSSLVMNPASKEVMMGNRNVALTPSQFRLLNRLLIASRPEAFHEGLENRLGWEPKDRDGPLEVYTQQVAELNSRPIEESSEPGQTIDRLFLNWPPATEN